ncbi:MAG: metallophosphoesterase [Polyangia bacterium]|jgi:predicted phosphodiesterase
MLICAAGDIHGKIDRLYAEVAAFERNPGRPFDMVLHVGDFGIWPDPTRTDKATRGRDGAGDFPVWYAERRRAPRRTIFVKGNHEDFDFLKSLKTSEVLPDLYYLRNGLIAKWDGLRVAGLGGCHSERDSDTPAVKSRQASPSHYTLAETQRLLGGKSIESERIDVLVTHDAPEGIDLGSYVTKGPNLRALIERKRPRVVFFGHHHIRARSEIAGVPVVGLAYVDLPGWLVAWDSERGLLAEWPEKARVRCSAGS